MTKEIIKRLYLERYANVEEIITIELGVKELKLLKELHGNIGLDEFLQELSDKIKGEIK